MQLLIDEFGAFVGKNGNRFVIKIKGKKNEKKEYSTDHVKQIVVSVPASISTEAMKLAVENGIDIVYLDLVGRPFARTYPCKLGGTTLTRRNQATKYGSEKASDFVKKIIKAKIENQTFLLKSLNKTRNDVDFGSSINEMLSLSEKVKDVSGTIDKMREELLGLEGRAGHLYFSSLTQIIPFKERQHEAKDPFNAVLNYGYGILYSEIERACVLAGLDPYLGFLHTDRYGKPSMVLDLIEEFRQPIVDRAVITLFVRKEIKDEDFEVSADIYTLSKNGKKKVIDAVLGRLHTKIKFKNSKITFQSIILHQARQFTKLLLGEINEYKPFVYRW